MKQNLGIKWRGEAAIDAGIGIYRGYAGDNKVHRHLAHQITFSLYGTFSLENIEGTRSCEGALIRSGTPHRLLPSHVVSIYLDPASDIFTWLFREQSPTDLITFFSRQDLEPLLSLLDASQELDAWLASIHFAASRRPDGSDRLSRVLSALRHAMRSDGNPGRNDLARIAALSPTRFSHWFREQTGVPLRSYKKWLKLQNGIKRVLTGQRLVDASLASGFTDQAHFSRSFSQAFGITLTEVIEAIASKPVSE